LNRKSKFGMEQLIGKLIMASIYILSFKFTKRLLHQQ
jgi:hypothetical protein